MSDKSSDPREERDSLFALAAAGDKECVWMRAKVVNFKLCDRDYDCADCRFDKAMKMAWEQGNGEKETLT